MQRIFLKLFKASEAI